jgi:hypothetical protein
MVQNGDRPGPEAILPTYEREAADWARGRVLTLWEAPALLAAVDGRAPGLRVLDLGCGSGEPIAAMVRPSRRPGDGGRWRGGDDRGTPRPRAGGRGHSCRHAGPCARPALRRDPRVQFLLPPLPRRSARHVPGLRRPCRAGATLLFTSGPAAGEAWGRVGARRSTTPRSTRRSTGRACRRTGSPRSGSGPTTRSLMGHSVWLARHG